MAFSVTGPGIGWSFILCMVLLVVVDGVKDSRFCQKVVEPLDYGCTEFTVQTDDGFVLALHRLSRTRSLSGTGQANNARSGITSAKNVTSKHRTPHKSSPTTSGATLPGVHKSHHDKFVHSSKSKDGRKSSSGNQNSSSKSRERVARSAPTLRAPAPHAPVQAPPASLGHNPREVQSHSNSASGSVQEGFAPSRPGSQCPLPDPSTSSSISNTNRSKQRCAKGPSADPKKVQDAPPQSSNHSSDSNYTANPEAGKGVPVLLMHQEFFNGDTWFQYVDADRHVSRLLPLMLLDDGFDVWIGHQRATYWGHGHVKLHSTDRNYWNWTWDQHAEYDLPAQLRFISAETNQRVHFVGVSQAATVAVAAAIRRETAQMLRSLALIGPTTYRGNSNSIMLNAWAYFFGWTLDSVRKRLIEPYIDDVGNGDLLKGVLCYWLSKRSVQLFFEFPPGPISGQGLSGMALGLISGPNCCLGTAPVQLSNGWDGTTSFKNLLHWQQGIRTNNFAHYDYGSPSSNILAYGQPTPPAYYPTQIPTELPVLVIAGGTDWTAPPQGIRNLMLALQVPTEVINLTSYAHYDLSFSVHREKDIYLPILNFLTGPKSD